MTYGGLCLVDGVGMEIGDADHTCPDRHASFLSPGGPVLSEGILGSRPRPAVAMFHALSSTTAKHAALRAAAREVLLDQNLELFEALFSLISSAAKDRNKIVHGIWGHADSLPDAVLICDVEKLTSSELALKEYLSSLQGMSANYPSQHLLHGIHVWREKDFKNVIRKIEQAANLLQVFHYMLLPRPSRSHSSIKPTM